MPPTEPRPGLETPLLGGARVEIRLELKGIGDLGHRVEALDDFDDLRETLVGDPEPPDHPVPPRSCQSLSRRLARMFLRKKALELPVGGGPRLVRETERI